MFKKRIIIAVIVFDLLLFAFFGYLFTLGMFNNIEITQKSIPSMKLVYENHKGPYHEITKAQNTVYNSLKKDNILTTKGFGLYYDDPQVVAADKLKSIGGSIIEKQDYNKLESVKNKYKIMDYSLNEAMYTEFPYSGLPSILLGVFKVYPALREYQTNAGYKPVPVMEIYDLPNNKIIYIAEIKK